MIATRLSRVPPIEHGLTLGDFLVPIRLGERAAIWQRNLLMIVAGTALIVAGAYVSFTVPAFGLGDIYRVPANQYVPFTFQTFSVLFVGALLGTRRGVASTGLYLLLGIVGLPVFAIDPATGIRPTGIERFATLQDGHVVLGATGGFLIGFLLAAAVVGRLAEFGWDRRLRGSIAAMIIGSVAIYLIGVPWLALAANLSVADALRFGLYPFVPGDILKLVVAAGLLPIGWRLVERRDHDL
ncbi:MAG: biotin transporter BioY [Chloroflexi bacterium]|nr:biotin transporter BioY [Chloroflexota bacterium]